MHDFGKFCYLDVQKTGSSFVSSILKRNSACNLVEFAKHRRISKKATPDCIYFITARNPLSLYLSLYNYGCDGRGAARRAVMRAGLESFYDGTSEGFDRFVEFLTSKDATTMAGLDYEVAEPEQIGIMTWRYLRLAIPGDLTKISQAKNKDTLKRLYLKRSLPKFVLHTESLADDLIELVKGPLGPFMTNVDKAIADIKSAGLVNSSNTKNKREKISPSLKTTNLIQEREWFFYEALGYKMKT